MISLLLLLACGTKDGETSETPPTSATTSDTTDTKTTGETAPTGSTGDTAKATGTQIIVDCSAGVPFPLTSTTTRWNATHEDFTFSADGEIVGVSGNVLGTTPYGGPFSVQQPMGDSEIRGTRFLPDGSLILADSAQAAILRLHPDSTIDVLGSGLLNPNGITVAPSGVAYVSTGDGVYKIDPSSGTVDKIITENTTLDGITMSEDHTKLYYNTEFHTVWVVDLDGNGDPLLDTKLSIKVPVGAFAILDGMTTDACGNVYVIEMSGKLFRITPEGQIDLALDIPGTPPITTPALNFGTGTGGFERDHLYVMDFRGWLHDIDIGIPGRYEPHLPPENHVLTNR